MATNPHQITVRVESIPGTRTLNIYIPTRALPKRKNDGANYFLIQDLDETLEILDKEGWRQQPIILDKGGSDSYLFFTKEERQAVLSNSSRSEDDFFKQY